jgi:elongation factor P
MKINGNEIRPGMMIEYDGGLWIAVKTMAVKPGKGPAYNQVEAKNIIDGRKLNNRFGSDEKVERFRLEQKDFQYLYRQGDMLVFMDSDTYEQIELSEEFVGERAAFLQDGMKVTLDMYEDRPIGIKLPDQVVLQIVEADAVMKGQTATSSYKPAKLENGLRIMVPPFVATGEKVVVDTNEITYIRRASIFLSPGFAPTDPGAGCISAGRPGCALVKCSALPSSPSWSPPRARRRAR